MLRGQWRSGRSLRFQSCVLRAERQLHSVNQSFDAWGRMTAAAAQQQFLMRQSVSDWALPIGFGGRMSAVAETGRSGLVQAADRSILGLDVWDTLNDRGPTCCRCGRPAADSRRARTGADDPSATLLALQRRVCVGATLIRPLNSNLSTAAERSASP